jgi:catechol 2,3-dioxygenase-like lactoylglutathione lyase family enzyme
MEQSPMEQRLSLVVLGVTDPTASRQFFERLGWRASSASTPDIAFFPLGGIALALYGRTALAEDAGQPERPGEGFSGDEGFGGIALAYNARSRDEVDAVLAAAVGAGGRLLRPAENAAWGGYSGYFADPDHHPWEVAWNPGFKIAPDGAVILPV